MAELKDTSIYQSVSLDYDVHQVIREWYGRFEALEKSDVWH